MSIPYGRQDVTQADVDAVSEALRSDFITQGPLVPAFERAVAEQCGARHAVAVNSATAALHVACLALGVGPDDEVWTSPITFVASANCALHCGARVDFVDIDPRTYNMSPERLEAKLEAAKAAGKLPKVVIAVHLAGQACEMAAFQALSRRYGFHLIEDASHAIGGRYRGEPIGSGAYSTVTVFSFHPVKIVTTGEGGMALTQDAELAARMRRLRTHGITRDHTEMTAPSEGPWYYEQTDLGFNYRLTDIQAALGLSQLQRLDQYVAKRKSLAGSYDTLLADLPVVTPFVHADADSAWHLYVIRLRLGEIQSSHRRVFERMRAGGIGVNVHYIPVYRQPYYRQYGYSPLDYPESESYYSSAITLPLYPRLSEEEQHRVVDILRDAVTAHAEAR
jgi:UDP-4-amino-4,6-dideoxy-N-acetyl-beta-L-altrosamine transaminase